MECKVIGWCSFHLVPCAPRVHLCGVTAHVGCLEPHLRDQSYAGPRLSVALMRRCHIHLSHALPFFLHPPVPHPLPPFACRFLVCTAAVGVTVPSRDGSCPFAAVLIAIWFARSAQRLWIWFSWPFDQLSLSLPLSVSIKCCLKCCQWSPRFKLKISLFNHHERPVTFLFPAALSVTEMPRLISTYLHLCRGVQN